MFGFVFWVLGVLFVGVFFACWFGFVLLLLKYKNAGYGLAGISLNIH